MGKEVFKKLSLIDVTSMLEKKSDLSYLTWSKAFNQVLALFDIEYKILKNEKGLPYFIDDNGAMVFTEITIEGDTKEMWLPVMDGANNALKPLPYTYDVKKKEWVNGKTTGKYIMETKNVDAINMFDVNKTIMRCLVKNLAMFGLGLDVYAGEDLPSVEEIEEKSSFSSFNENDPITENQIKKIKEIMAKKNIVKEDFFGKKLEEITIAEAKEVITLFTKMKAVKKEVKEVEKTETPPDTIEIIQEPQEKKENEVSVLDMFKEEFKNNIEK